MKKLNDFAAKKIELKSIYGGVLTKPKYIITGNNEDYIEES